MRRADQKLKIHSAQVTALLFSENIRFLCRREKHDLLGYRELSQKRHVNPYLYSSENPFKHNYQIIQMISFKRKPLTMNLSIYRHLVGICETH